MDDGSITVRAPGRVNLIGDHTDYTGGLVFPIAIDRWTEVTGRHADRVRLVSEDDPETIEFDIDREPDPTEFTSWGRLVAAVAAEIWAKEPDHLTGLDGRVRSTLPIGAGLSSSASLELAVAVALGFSGTPRELAELGRRAEHRATGVPSGIMDQLCIATARSGHGTLIDCHTFDVRHVAIPDDVVIEVQFIAPRTLEGSEYATRVAECAEAEQVIGPLRTASTHDLGVIADDTVRCRARHVITENARVGAFAEFLTSGDYREAGALMVESHRSLSTDFEVSTSALDRAVSTAIAERGVFGARMTGGGFGGCIVVLRDNEAPTARRWRVRPADGVAATMRGVQGGQSSSLPREP
ncbi:MAG: galactokinase family protein [Ilumatobacteraceae bacterium]